MAVATRWMAALALALAACGAGAQEGEEASLRAPDEAIRWWREARFGLFIHWGPVSLKGTEIGWSRGGERRGRKGTGEIPAEVYDKLYQDFNPVAFDAEAWVRLGLDAGAKYLVFTAKHHDGFCMFDSRQTDYTIMNSPFGRDVARELAEACHKFGMRLGFYYSQPDWHHPHYQTRAHSKYIEYLHAQVRELLTNYGRVDILWFDGLGGSAHDWDAYRLFEMVRELQPHILINNRAGLPGDYDTPEQRVGRFGRERPWESCITLCRQWAWKPNDEMKPLEECVGTLVRCAGGDGNLLLNVGPMPNGEIEPRQAKRLRQVGAWLKEHGETIYGTRGGPYAPGRWGAATSRGSKAYLHVLDWPGEQLALTAPPLAIEKAALWDGTPLDIGRNGDRIVIDAPGDGRDGIDTIVTLTLAGDAEAVVVKGPHEDALSFEKRARASNVFNDNRVDYGPEKAVDGDPTTRWATDVAEQQAWLEVDLGAPAKVSRARIDEEYGRTRKFAIEVYREGQWIAVATGGGIGGDFEIAFTPTSARRVRLHVLQSGKGPSFREFQVFGEEE